MNIIYQVSWKINFSRAVTQKLCLLTIHIQMHVCKIKNKVPESLSITCYVLFDSNLDFVGFVTHSATSLAKSGIHL